MTDRWERLGRALKNGAIMALLGVLLTTLIAQIAQYFGYDGLLRLSFWLSIGIVLCQFCIAGRATYLVGRFWWLWRRNVRELRPQSFQMREMLHALLRTVLAAWMLVFGVAGMPMAISLMQLVPEVVYVSVFFSCFLATTQHRLSVRMEQLETSLTGRFGEHYIRP